MHKELNQSTGNAGLNNSLDLVVRTIREVGDSPASINQDFVVQRVNQLGQDGEGGRNLAFTISI